AAVLIVEIGDISRFKKFDRLNSFVGLCPMEHSTGENDRKGSITTRQHRRLRYMLVEAAWVAVRTDPALTLCYSR
ncbi:Transposase IS116/IS110/IS902 family protein, partial [Pedobacter suwonensis]